MKSLARTILASAVLFLAPLAAAAAPGIPHQFYGTVRFDNGSVPAPDGILVEVKTALGLVVGSSTTASGRYGYTPSLLFVNDPDDGSSTDVSVGQTLQFFVNGINTGSTAVFANGELAEKNLTLSGAIGAITKTESDVIADQNMVVSPASSASITMGSKLSIGITSTTTSEALVERVEQLGADTVVAISGKNLLNAYDIKISGASLTISVTMSYDDTGIDENTIAPHRYHNNVWSEISPYSINKTNNTLTFTITAGQTVYAVFGATPSTPPASGDTGNGGNNGGGGGGGGGGGYIPVTQNNTPAPTTTPDAGSIEPDEGQVLGSTVGVYPNGTLLKAPNSNTVWYISGDKKHAIPSPAVFTSRFGWDNIIRLPSARQLDLFDRGEDVKFAPNTLIKIKGEPAVYRVSASGGLQPIVSGRVFLDRFYRWSDVIEVEPGFLSNYPEETYISGKDSFYTGDLIKVAGASVNYYLDGTNARRIPSNDIFASNGFKSASARSITAAQFKQFAAGSDLGYPDGTLLKGSKSAVYVISNGKKQAFHSNLDFEALLYNYKRIRKVTDAFLAQIENSSPIRLVQKDIHTASN